MQHKLVVIASQMILYHVDPIQIRATLMS